MHEKTGEMQRLQKIYYGNTSENGLLELFSRDNM